MEAIKEKINKAKISNNVKKNLTDLINDKKFYLNLKKIIKYENQLFEEKNTEAIKKIIEIIKGSCNILSNKSKVQDLKRYITWSEMKSKHPDLRQLIKEKFVAEKFQHFNDITELSVNFLLNFLKKNKLLEDSVLTTDVKETLIELILNIAQDTTVKYTMEDLGCYMRGDDKNYGLMHTNSTFTKRILENIEKIMNFIGNDIKDHTSKKKYLKWWMKTYATRNKRYVEVSSSECGETANKRKLPKLKL